MQLHLGVQLRRLPVELEGARGGPDCRADELRDKAMQVRPADQVGVVRRHRRDLQQRRRGPPHAPARVSACNNRRHRGVRANLPLLRLRLQPLQEHAPSNLTSGRERIARRHAEVVPRQAIKAALETPELDSALAVTKALARHGGAVRADVDARSGKAKEWVAHARAQRSSWIAPKGVAGSVVEPPLQLLAQWRCRAPSAEEQLAKRRRRIDGVGEERRTRRHRALLGHRRPSAMHGMCAAARGHEVFHGCGVPNARSADSGRCARRPNASFLAQFSCRLPAIPIGNGSGGAELGEVLPHFAVHARADVVMQLCLDVHVHFYLPNSGELLLRRHRHRGQHRVVKQLMCDADQGGTTARHNIEDEHHPASF
mmetsp:Transcript_70553/g.204465  ORF Transcript_70553/g.204465 Transcript_70553/m.204465 type:complete len:370 (-) Transcript_70553:1354-2463(-)